MRPDIGDLIEGIKRSLSEEILPTVTDAFAREQLAYSLFLCEHLASRWDQAHLFFHREHADLHATLGAVVEIGRRCTAPTARFRALLESTAIALAADESAAPRPLRALSTASHALKEAAAQFLEVCAAAAPPDRDVFDEIRATLHACMKRQLEHEEEWVTGAQIGWW